MTVDQARLEILQRRLGYALERLDSNYTDKQRELQDIGGIRATVQEAVDMYAELSEDVAFVKPLRKGARLEIIKDQVENDMVGVFPVTGAE